jgi:polyhydroxybutyrate depolymerase
MAVRRRLLALVLGAVAAGACSAGGGSVQSPPPPGPSVSHRQLTFAGQTRGYRLYAPATADRARRLPLVLVLGGVGDSADSMANATGFDREADAGGFIVVYAEGVRLNWAAGFCCSGPDSNSVDDVGFFNHLLDQLESVLPVDPSRIYATGVSAGAMMAYRLACEDANRIAGIGSVAGTMLFATCHPTRPVSVIEIHGTVDPLVPFDGGEVSPPGVATQPVPSATALAQHWAVLDSCANPLAVQTQPPVTTSTWASCAAGTGVRLIAIEGGGHTWFATGFGAANGAVDATHEIWSYLSGLHRTP